MGWGRFYEIADSACARFNGCKAKNEWYAALGDLGMEDLPELDAEESVPEWGAALENHEGPLGRLFVGDMRTEQDEYDDPNVLFAGRQLVAEIAEALDGLNQDYFARIFRKHAVNEREAWLYGPLQKFFSSARQNDSAVVLMWEN